MLIFEVLNLSKSGAKLLQKPIYIQILRFIVAFCKMLKYSTLIKQNLYIAFMGLYQLAYVRNFL